MGERNEMTGAELLREAARLMRERAERAGGSDPSPWRSEGSDVLYVGIMADDPIGKFDLPHWAEHAASWHPGVALAVADWLDLEADCAAIEGATYGPAITVARAYLSAPVSAGESESADE